MADPSTTPVSPFNPAAVQVPRDGPGCSKPLLIGCGLLLLLLGAGIVLIRVEAPAIFRWTFHVAETSLTPRLPADATPAERQRLHQAFAAAGRSVGADQADLGNLQRVQREIMTLSGSQAALTHQQLRELTAALEALVIGTMESSLAPRLPAGLDAEERRRLHQAFAAAGAAAGSDRLDVTAMLRLQGRISALARSQGPLARKDVSDLTESVEALVQKPAAPAEPPAPGPGKQVPQATPPGPVVLLPARAEVVQRVGGAA